jgi:pSer/pThr/pTyr-binding forkhead associated (FHA) protein
MPNDINATSSTATPSFSLGIAPNYLGVVSLVNPAGEVVRRWRLQNTKCTIGSDRQATIWLDDSKIASFHALLVFGSTNAIIKSFGPGLRLNGQPVQESALRVGDRVELLGYQFLIESLSTSTQTVRSGAKMPDASSAIDSAQLNRPQVALSTETIHFSKLEGRVDQLLQRLGDIDDKITRTSSEQKVDFSRQCDSLRSETEHLRRVITQDFTSQLRNLTDDLERQNKAREGRFDSKFQTLSDEFKHLCADVENSFESLQQQADSRIEQLETLQQQSNERFTQLESLQQEAAERLQQLQLDNAQLANNLPVASTPAGVTPDEFNSFQERMVDLVQSIQGDLQDVRSGLDSKLDSVQQESNERLAQIEAATAALSDQVNRVSEPNENTQPEIEALQARLTQLENVLADLAATVHDRSAYSPSNTTGSSIAQLSHSPMAEPNYSSPSDDIPRHDNYNDFVPQSVSLKPNQNATTQRFNSDATTPYHQAANEFTERYAEEADRDSADAVYNRYVESFDANAVEEEQSNSTPAPLPAWFTQSQERSAIEESPADYSTAEAHIEQRANEPLENAYSPLLRSSEDEESSVTPLAHWSTASSAPNIDAISNESFDEDVSHSPLLRSLLKETADETEDSSAESPMFNQKDWDESDSYLQSERPASVSALDILRASYNDSSKDQFDDEQEEKWSNKLQQFSDAIHEEPDASLSAIGRALPEEQAHEAFEEEQPVEEEVESVPPTPPPAPARLGVGAARGRSAANNPPTAEPSAAGDDDSVEAYMQRLLARMRGDEPEEIKPSASSAAPVAKASPAKSSNSKAVRNTYSPLRKTRQDPAAALIASRPKVDEEGIEPNATVVENENPEPQAEVTVSRSAPEKASDLAALRELANDSARAAVKTSDKKVKPISNTIKLTIAGLAAAFGVLLLISNGLRVNLTLVAAATAFMLSAIWVLDVIQAFASSKKREQSNGGGANNFQMKVAGKK